MLIMLFVLAFSQLESGNQSKETNRNDKNKSISKDDRFPPIEVLM